MSSSQVVEGGFEVFLRAKREPSSVIQCSGHRRPTGLLLMVSLFLPILSAVADVSKGQKLFALQVKPLFAENLKSE